MPMDERIITAKRSRLSASTEWPSSNADEGHATLQRGCLE